MAKKAWNIILTRLTINKCYPLWGHLYYPQLCSANHLRKPKIKHRRYFHKQGRLINPNILVLRHGDKRTLGWKSSSKPVHFITMGTILYSYHCTHFRPSWHKETPSECISEGVILILKLCKSAGWKERNLFLRFSNRKQEWIKNNVGMIWWAWTNGLKPWLICCWETVIFIV